MDEMSIRSNFMRGLIGSLLVKWIKKHLGVNVEVDVSKLSAVTYDEDNGFRIDVGLSVYGDRNEILKLMK